MHNGAYVLPESSLRLRESHLLEVHPHRDVDADEQISRVVCYRRTAGRTAVVVLGGIGTLTFLWLFMLWYVRFRAWILCKKCSPEEATHLLITSQHASTLERPILRETARGQLLTFTHRYLHYYVQDNAVHPLIFETALPYSDFHRSTSSGHQSDLQVQQLRDTYGSCKIEVPEPNLCSL